MSARKIFDCFLYNGEEKMLFFRLNELYDKVDYFIISESKYTFKGDDKDLTFNINDKKYDKFKNKIIYVTHSTTPSKTDSWLNERNQRDNLINGFKNIKEDIKSNDIILLSDVDEIPDFNNIDIPNLGNNILVSFLHNFYYYNIKCRKKNKWVGTVVLDLNTFIHKFRKSFEYVRQHRWSNQLIGKNNDYTSGGWHFSYFGDADYIISKIESFSHQEYNNDKYKNKEKILKLIENGEDLFFRESENPDEKMTIADETYLPVHSNLIP